MIFGTIEVAACVLKRKVAAMETRPMVVRDLSVDCSIWVLQVPVNQFVRVIAGIMRDLAN